MCALPCMTRFGWCGWWGVGAGTERNHVCSAVYDALRVVRVVGVGAGTERNHVCSAVYGAFVNSDADGL